MYVQHEPLYIKPAHIPINCCKQAFQLCYRIVICEPTNYLCSGDTQSTTMIPQIPISTLNMLFSYHKTYLPHKPFYFTKPVEYPIPLTCSDIYIPPSYTYAHSPLQSLTITDQYPLQSIRFVYIQHHPLLTLIALYSTRLVRKYLSCTFFH